MTATGPAPLRGDLSEHVPELTEARLLDTFAVHDARAILLVGSRITGFHAPGSDVDFLAVFDDADALPAGVSAPGAVSFAHSLGENWIADVEGQEVNVESVHAGTIRRVVGLLARPLAEHSAPIIQPLEIRLLDRLRRCAAVRGGDYVRSLSGDGVLDRLAAVAVVMRYVGVTSNLPAIRLRLEEGDEAGAAMVVSAMAGALALASMNLHENMDTAWRKVGPALRELERQGADLPVTSGDLAAMLSAPASEGAEQVAAAMDRLRGAVERRALSDPVWAEALRGLEAQ